jgi:hypothetical protein
MVSSDSSTYVCSEDNANFNEIQGMQQDANIDLSDSESEEIVEEPRMKKTKPNYELTRRFQIEWAVEHPWAEMILTIDGFLHMVRCRVCTDVGKKAYVMGLKKDTVNRHTKRKSHKRNLFLYATKRPTTIL